MFRKMTAIAGLLIPTFLAGRATHAADTGMLYVKSDPPGATVVIGGVERGKTPVLVRDLPEGKTRIEFRVGDAVFVVLQETVVARNVTTVQADVRAPTATLTVVSDPLEATVFLDRAELGRTPFTKTGIPPGSHRLLLLKEGCPRMRRKVALKPGEERVLEVKLRTEESAAGTGEAAAAPEDPAETWRRIEKRAAARRIPVDEEYRISKSVAVFLEAHGRADAVPSLDRRSVDVLRRAKRASGLLAHWTFDEGTGDVARERAGSGCHARIAGAKWTEGWAGGALEFDGSRAHVIAPDYPKPRTVATYACWVYARSIPQRNSSILKNWGHARHGHVFWGLSPLGKLSLGVEQAGGAAVDGVDDTTPFPTATWVHVALVADGRMVKLYRDAVQVARSPYDGTLKQGYGPLGIGVKPSDTGAGPDGMNPEHWDGRIDDVRVYARALGVEELRSLIAAAEE
ncbi:MAG: PEGA domain-containing protein [Planctomycetota bacterium]